MSFSLPEEEIDIQNNIENLEQYLKDLHSIIQPFVENPSEEIYSKLEEIEKVKLNILISNTLVNLFYSKLFFLIFFFNKNFSLFKNSRY